MSKRFTATDKWDDPWFFGLNNTNKLFWLYLLDNCNHAGIWQVNIKLVEFRIKDFVYEPEVFKDRIFELSSEKWFIRKFVDFQYGELNKDNRAHQSVISILQKEGAYKGHTSPLLGAKDKDKDKDKDTTSESSNQAIINTTNNSFDDRFKDQTGGWNVIPYHVLHKKDKISFVKPTIEEVKAYCVERSNTVDADKWFDYYQSNGWRVGRNPMKDWRAAIRTWEKSSFGKQKLTPFQETISAGQRFMKKMQQKEKDVNSSTVDPRVKSLISGI
jgi:hypothetical protein